MGKVLRTGPVALGTSAANVFQGAGGDAAMRDRIKHIHIANRGAVPVTFDLYIGATGGSASGTELEKGKTIAANDVFNEYYDCPIASTEYLTGLASLASSLTITVTYEREVV
jgi:hypothetical protein